jgi:hypothetical protein
MRGYTDLPPEILDYIFTLTDVTTALRNLRPWCLRYMPAHSQREISWTHAAMKGNVFIMDYLLTNQIPNIGKPQLMDVALRNRRLKAAAFISKNEDRIRNVVFPDRRRRWKIPFFTDTTLIDLAVSCKFPELRWLISQPKVKVSCSFLNSLLRMASLPARDEITVELLTSLKKDPRRVKKVTGMRNRIRHPNELVNAAAAALIAQLPSLKDAFILA